MRISSRNVVMMPEKLDFIFPFFVFAYGALMTLVLSSPRLLELAETRFPANLNAQMKSHRALALFCLLGGALWSLQNLWAA